MTTLLGHVEGAGALLAAALDGDHVEGATGAGAPGRDERRGQHDDDGGERAERDPVRAAGPHRRRPSAPSAKPSENTTHVMRITPPTRAMPAERTADLGDPQAGQRHAAEREREPQRLDQGVNAAGRPSTRQRPFGAAREASPCNVAKITPAAM